MSLGVIDASALTAFYAADDLRRSEVAARLGVGDALFAPAHMDAEVVSALRRLAQRNPALRAAVPDALRHLAGFPIRRMPLAPLLLRVWELRDNVTPYVAAYLALAEQLRAPLITCDAKLVAASGSSCTFDLLT